MSGNEAWRSEASIWCQDFRRFLGGPWREREAAELFERIEGLAALAELISDTEVADATAELTVFLCAFADSHLHPDMGQKRRLLRLVGELEESLPRPVVGTETSPVVLVAGTKAPLFRALYLRDRLRHQDALVTALRHDRMEVHVADSLEEALEQLEQSLPDALVLDAEFVADLRRLSQPGRTQVAASWRRVVVAATGVEDHVRTRLQARRAGVDLLLEGEADADVAAGALLEAILRRRDEAYRVLVVEDDRSHAVFCESLLRHQGFEVDVADSAEVALDIIEMRTPDLILLDINLPDMTGIEFAQLVRERHSLAHVALVFLTGEEDLERRAEAIAVGGDDFLSKPVRPRHLLANVNSRIGRARSLALSAPAERPHDGLAQRLDRVRFVETLERLRSENAGCACVVVYVLDEVANVADKLGFVGAGNLALQIAQQIEADCGGLGRTCGIGEFSRLALLQETSEKALTARAESLRRRLSEHPWGTPTEPLKVSFSAGLVRFDASLADRDALIADAIAMADNARREGGGRLRFHDLR